MTPTLHGNDISQAHTYLAKAWPDWTATMQEVRLKGGPWACDSCQGASLLCYRCSKCGAELPDH